MRTTAHVLCRGLLPPHRRCAFSISSGAPLLRGAGSGIVLYPLSEMGTLSGAALRTSRRLGASNTRPQAATSATSSSTSSWGERLLFRLESRIPRVPGHESAAQVKWATFLFWWCLDPILRCHFQYYQLKRRLDRLLEKQPLWANIALGILAGLTLYFSLLHFLFPTTLPGEYYNIQEDAEEVLALISDANNPAGIAASSSSSSPTATGGDGGSSGVGSMADLPAFRLMRVKGEIICKLHYIVDMAEIRRQQRAVAALVAESKKAGEATHAAAAASE